MTKQELITLIRDTIQEHISYYPETPKERNEEIENAVIALADKLYTKRKIKYHTQGAYHAGVTTTPSVDVKALGMQILSWHSEPMGDFIVMQVKNVPDVLPDYIDLLPLDEED